MKNDKNKMMLSVVVVLLIITITSGVTTSYFTWRNDNTNKTNVILSVISPFDNGDLMASIDGDETVLVSGLSPSSCIGNNAFNKKITIKYQNKTDFIAHITVHLKLISMIPLHTSSKSFPTNQELAHLHIALTSQENDCMIHDEDVSKTFKDIEPNFTPIDMITKEFDIPAKMLNEQSNTYYLYIWLDEDYTGLDTLGSNVLDIMQDLKLKLIWSGEITQK